MNATVPIVRIVDDDASFLKAVAKVQPRGPLLSRCS